MLYPSISRDSIAFGRYIQTGFGSPEPIEWKVLVREKNRMLVISKFTLDCQRYNTKNTNVTWETSTLRKWLNGTFLNTAFSEIERNMIPSVTVSADRNPYCTTNPGNNTKDQVFLLSTVEANKYFSSDKARLCAPTDYAKAQGAYTCDSYGKKAGWWWLRSPGGNHHAAAYVNWDGNIANHRTNHGLLFNADSLAIRPALWINLDS